MTNSNLHETLRLKARDFSFILISAVVALSALMPVIFQMSANAATLSNRSVLISDSTPDKAAVSYTFTFTTISATPIQSMIYQFCTTPLGTCILPGTDGTPTAAERIDVDQGTASSGAFTGTNATAFTDVGTDTGACTDADTGSGTSTMLCANRTQAANEGIGIKTFAISNISNPIIAAGNNEQVYVRVATYSDTAFATPVDSGVVAASIVNQLTVNGRVQERLVFCVYALDDAAGSNATVGVAATNYPTNCSAAEATASSTIDIGTIDNLAIVKSPVNNTPPTSTGNDRFGGAQVNTNASTGVTVTYFPTLSPTGSNQLRDFRVAPATCNASNANLTDQCFQNAGTTGTTFTAGTEDFGLQVACIANSTTQAGAGTTSNLGSGGSGSGSSGGTFNTNYSNTDNSVADDGSDDCENGDAGVKFAWDNSGSAVPLVNSSTVVDDELIKMRFGATASATTPTGSYTVSVTYIATPIF